MTTAPEEISLSGSPKYLAARLRRVFGWSGSLPPASERTPGRPAHCPAPSRGGVDAAVDAADVRQVAEDIIAGDDPALLGNGEVGAAADGSSGIHERALWRYSRSAGSGGSEKNASSSSRAGIRNACRQIIGALLCRSSSSACADEPLFLHHSPLVTALQERQCGGK